MFGITANGERKMYDRVLELQVLLFAVRARLVLFGLLGAPDRVSFFSELILYPLFNQLPLLRLLATTGPGRVPQMTNDPTSGPHSVQQEHG